ncbi:MAG TPA: hypothetical protein VK457_22200 [Chloroflexota bacterium]|nr:hypothetical protein [Chloroflexota bacterium]
MRKLRLLLIGAVAALLFGLSLFPSHGQSLSHRVAGLSITEDVSAQQEPKVGADRASSIALLKLLEFSPDLKGLVVTSTYHSPAFLSATDESGRLVLNFRAARDVWVIQFRAPSQDSWANIRALVTINAQSGIVESASLAKWN